MIFRFIFLSMFIPFLELYVQAFIRAEKMYRKYTGKEKPGVPEHLREWQE